MDDGVLDDTLEDAPRPSVQLRPARTHASYVAVDLCEDEDEDL